MLLPAIVIWARILADYDMLKIFLASMSYIYIYIFFFFLFFPQLKHYNFKNTPIYGHLASRRLNRGYFKQSEDTSSKALIEGNRLTT